ncbi:putative efflux protein, MATE family [Clostridium sp. DSM 8431]|uniref:MATE family efflux transporter n=1 Tax=Clostridium sp. DSM 8431 TaxID=1761781 RepID=UPI0008E54CC3|nr:MATE family efflux transporter [Clostridium sp. DSM 8431]SFU66157.1 putative efflux protein, MATE family [Clostridium sp. DSM 8431]
MESSRKVTDMTSGNIVRLIILFALPIFLGNILQQIYNIADTIIVGYTLGDNALAAIGATSSIYSLIIGMSNGMNNGYSIIIARYFGEKSEEKIKKSVALMIVLNIVVSILLTVISVIAVLPVLRLLNTPELIIGDSYKYIIIILIGMISTNIYNMESGILRAVGNSRTPLLFLSICLIINIILDFMFVVIFKMGIEGAALATVLSQILSAVLCYINRVKNYPQLRISKENFNFSKEFVKEMFGTGLSMGMVNSIFAIGSVVLQSSINSLGNATITANLGARKVDEMLMLPLVTLSNANATFIGQNFGAKKMNRIKDGIMKTCLIGFVWTSIIVVVISLFSDTIIQIITGTTEVYIINMASKYLKINIPFFYVLGVLFVFRTSLQGIGNKVAPMVSSTIELVGKCFSTWYLTPKLGYTGVCVTEPIVWVLCTLFLMGTFFKDYKKLLSN